MSAAPTHQELAALYERVAQWVTQRLRNKDSPSLNARALVECKQGLTHYAIPLSGVNKLTFDFSVATDMETVFPGTAIETTPDPVDPSLVQYRMLVPLERATEGRLQHRRQMPYRPYPVAHLPPQQQGGSVQTVITLLMGIGLVCVLLWFLLLAPMLK